ncbi:MAG: hypothetical protein IAE79_15640 [Anaerolinea sp.]|nr:hypothetical protein [Anaerolinea sp.]
MPDFPPQFRAADATADRQTTTRQHQINSLSLVTAVQKYIYTRTDFYRDFTNQPEVKSFLVNELFRYDYDGLGT